MSLHRRPPLGFLHARPGAGAGRLRLSAAQAGFSAVEMLVVIGIIGLMVLITAPQMMNFWKSMKVRTAAHKLMSHARLCRQAAVAKRTPVMLELKRTTSSQRPSYKAWEERSASGTADHLVRNPAGVDTTVNTVDDERWVVREEKTLATEQVVFVDAWDRDPADVSAASVMEGDVLRLKFLSNGQVVRIKADNSQAAGDPEITMRLQRQITGTRTDQWDVLINRVGKVGSEYNRVAP